MGQTNEPRNKNRSVGEATSRAARRRPDFGEPATPHTWSAADAALLHWMIANVTEEGCGVILGKTQDGGALSLTILMDNDKEKFYIKPSDDLNLKLREIGEYYGIS